MLMRAMTRRSRTLIGASVVVLLVAAGALAYQQGVGAERMRAYCAEMPDSIGLYVDSAVTVLGVPVGKVTKVAPDGPTARVDFEIPESRRLPADVGATTLSSTLIADRRLALIGTEPTQGAPQWDSSDCITTTVTPKSITRTLSAMTELSDELNGASGGISTGDVNTGLADVNNATRGVGPQINEIVLGLGRALDSPDAAIGRIGELIDVLSEMTTAIDRGWGDIKSMLVRLAPTLVSVDIHLMSPATEIIKRLRDVLPMGNDLTSMIAGPLLGQVGDTENLAEMIAAGVGSLGEAIEMVPVFTRAFEQATDPQTGALTFAYAAPPSTMPADARTQVCDLIGAHLDICGDSTPFAARLPEVIGSGGGR